MSQLRGSPRVLPGAEARIRGPAGSGAGPTKHSEHQIVLRGTVQSTRSGKWQCEQWAPSQGIAGSAKAKHFHDAHIRDISGQPPALGRRRQGCGYVGQRSAKVSPQKRGRTAFDWYPRRKQFVAVALAIAAAIAANVRTQTEKDEKERPRTRLGQKGKGEGVGHVEWATKPVVNLLEAKEGESRPSAVATGGRQRRRVGPEETTLQKTRALQKARAGISAHAHASGAKGHVQQYEIDYAHAGQEFGGFRL